MIETRTPDLRTIALHVLLDTDDTTLHHGLQWIGTQADQAPALAEASDGTGGGGAERVD
ncbi:hypothetical protein [Streptomyces sp. NPDC046197]|uniref:hypothetical protein n=1 Tax=Streptomyces sp. NPDC046197 TaxID=3154337 RepID=UPI0033EF07E3